MMKNPFNSNQNYLFRKNYHLISKPQASPPSEHQRSVPKVQITSLKNPFLGPTPIALQPTHSPLPFLNQSRSLSSSRAGLSSGFQGHHGFHTGRLMSGEAWKKELQSEQRRRVSVYGVQGLRYNAYSSYSGGYEEFKQSQLEKKPSMGSMSSQYYTGGGEYQSRRKKAQPDRYESQQYGMEYSKVSSHKNGNSRNQNTQSRHSNSLSRNLPKLNKEPMSFRNKEDFVDQINEDDVEQRVERRVQAMRYDSAYDEGVADTSMVKDMFSSGGYDAIDREMQHNSFVYTTDMMVESMPKYSQKSQSRCKEPSTGRRRVSIETDYDLGMSRGEYPPTIKVAGLIFFKVEWQ